MVGGDPALTDGNSLGSQSPRLESGEFRPNGCRQPTIGMQHALPWQVTIEARPQDMAHESRAPRQSRFPGDRAVAANPTDGDGMDGSFDRGTCGIACGFSGHADEATMSPR